RSRILSSAVLSKWIDGIPVNPGFVSTGKFRENLYRKLRWPMSTNSQELKDAEHHHDEVQDIYAVENPYLPTFESVFIRTEMHEQRQCRWHNRDERQIDHEQLH